MSDKQDKKVQYAAWIGVIGNLLLALMKGSIGWFVGSKALLADAAHTAASVASSLGIWIGLRSAKLAKDEDQANNSGNKQLISAVIVSVLLLVVGIESGVFALKSIYLGTFTSVNNWALAAITISIVSKEIIFRYRYNLSKNQSSQSLLVSAMNYRSDVYSSILALVGIAGSLLGKSIEMPLLYILDPIAALLIAGLIITKAYKLLKRNIHSTLNFELHQEDAESLLSVVQYVKGVITIDELRAREQGHYVIVEIKISVNPSITVLEGEDIAKQIKQALMLRFIHVSDVLIQVHPYDPGYPYKNNVIPHADDVPTLLH